LVAIARYNVLRLPRNLIGFAVSKAAASGDSNDSREDGPVVARGLQACKRSGMPRTHAACFQRVADDTRCVIACRSVGPLCTTLIKEGYATKGFHVKAKSCNWGPMAGFVLSDPRFSKRGATRTAVESQRRDIHHAIYKEGADEIQVCMSDRRRKELERRNCIERTGGTINEMGYTAEPPSGGRMRFMLRRTLVPGGDGEQLWTVFYAPRQLALSGSFATTGPTRAAAPVPVMAMIDPHCAQSVRDTYRAAITGDYDLWAVFPRASQFKEKGVDRRPVPGSQRFVLPIRDFIRHEDRHMGNITPRVTQIKNRLNAAIRAAGYTGGDIVHHSDEAGRPLVDAVELNFIAFVPRHRGAYFIESRADLDDFFSLVIADYYITLNPGWQGQLGFGATRAGNWEV
jgi:hypothetical protein